MKSNFEFKKLAKISLQNEWGKAIVFLVIAYACKGILGASGLGAFLIGAVLFSVDKMFLDLIRRNKLTLCKSFDVYITSVGIFILKGIFVFLWSLLFIIPGIIANYSYRMSYYILNDNPELGMTEALKKSKELMSGNKMRMLKLDLSFIGWAILALLTFGLSLLYSCPYYSATMAHFYNDLVGYEENNQKMQDDATSLVRDSDTDFDVKFD